MRIFTRRCMPGGRSPWLAVAAVAAGLPAIIAGLMPVSSSLASPQQRRVTKSKGAPPRGAVVNFRELALQRAAGPPRARGRKIAPHMRPPIRRRVPARIPTLSAEPEAAARISPLAPRALSPAAAVSVEALGDNNTAIPPDTQGAVGPNHLMVTLNSEVRITSKTVTNPSTVSLDSFWASLNSPDIPDPFDPKIAYDHMSGRWIFVVTSNKRSATSSLLIATSQTSDPTGNWDMYRVIADTDDEAPPVPAYWADYPSLGFNKDWIVVTYNAFAVSGDAFVQSDIYAFKKADLYAGTAATHTLFYDEFASTLVPATTFDNSLDTMYLVQTQCGNCTDTGFLEIETITGAVGSEDYTPAIANPTTINTWDDMPPPPGSQDFAPQMGSSEKIQTNDSRMLSLTYRNGSLWAAHTVFLPAGGSPTRSAVQWWQFEPDGTIQQLGRIDDPTATLFRAFPSLAVNSQNDVLVGYSTFSASTFASAAYSFRAGTDTASTMQSEVTLKAGEAKYFKTFGGPDNRWGDYSNTVVDPANDLDMWTIQEYAETPALFGEDLFDRWGTWWGKIAVTPAVVKKRTGQVISD